MEDIVVDFAGIAQADLIGLIGSEQAGDVLVQYRMA
jgi:hypothetical protein